MAGSASLHGPGSENHLDLHFAGPSIGAQGPETTVSVDLGPKLELPVVDSRPSFSTLPPPQG